VNSRGIVTEALFPRKFWNHHDAALKDEAKTTCGLEEWHKDMKSAINKYPQKTLWYLLMHLKDQFGRPLFFPTALDRTTERTAFRQRLP
jgi:hypothetical protein